MAWTGSPHDPRIRWMRSLRGVFHGRFQTGEAEEPRTALNPPGEGNKTTSADTWTGERIGTLFERTKEAENPQYPYYPWKNRNEYDLVESLTTSGLSQAKIDKLLQIWASNISTLSKTIC